MQESIETALRNAQHLESAWTLIHHIVGVGEQQLAQQNALKALEYGVFQTPDQIQSMLTTLQTHDWYDYRNPSWMQGESACYQDAVQYMFTPLGPDGQPTVNTARAMHIFQWDINSEAERQATQARVEALTPDDAYNAIAVADEVARDLVEKWRTGYPDVRAEDLQRVAEKKSHTNIITEQLIPSLGRAYFLIYRSEAARRGTQVAYAANLYHATYGTWPASLEQLDGIIEPQTRIDPFTGNDLGYRVDENGPVIYSVGGNMIDDGGTNTDLRWLGNGDEKKGDDLVFWPTPN
jgi:hypothetical protein